MDPLSTGLDALYASPLAEDATWRAVAGGAQAVRVIRRVAASARDWAPVGSAREQPILAVRVSEVAQPAEGDEIDLAGRTYRVLNVRHHPHVAEWSCEVEEVTP